MMPSRRITPTVSSTTVVTSAASTQFTQQATHTTTTTTSAGFVVVVIAAQQSVQSMVGIKGTIVVVVVVVVGWTCMTVVDQGCEFILGRCHTSNEGRTRAALADGRNYISIRGDAKKAIQERWLLLRSKSVSKRTSCLLLLLLLFQYGYSFCGSNSKVLLSFSGLWLVICCSGKVTCPMFVVWCNT